MTVTAPVSPFLEFLLLKKKPIQEGWLTSPFAVLPLLNRFIYREEKKVKAGG